MASGNILAAFGAGSAIKSVQHGTISINGTSAVSVTVTAVNTAKSMLIAPSVCGATAGGTVVVVPELTSSTTLRFSPNNDASGYYSWQLVEFN